jgi:hypothetical protein
MSRFARLSIIVLTLTGCGQGSADPIPHPAEAAAEVVVAWNARVLSVAEAEDHFLTLKGVRTAAMMHLAMHDAVNAVDPRYHPYLRGQDGGPAGSAPADVDPLAVASEAAYAVVVSQYPDQDLVLRAERSRWSEGEVGRARRLGSRIAAAVLEARRGDRWDADPAYEWPTPAPGVYAGFPEHSGTPEGFTFGAGWARARPFMMDTPTRFRAPPPPDVGSAEYAAAYREVKEVGSRHSRTRTDDQTHLALWWKEFVEKSHNRLARELTAQEGLDLWEAARLFALLNMSIFDGYVASFDSKYHYNHWRPYTAIRRAGEDGNPATEPDPDWTNLHDHTYAFPSYPSAHGCVCGAAMTVLADVFGDDRPFVMTIREVDSAGPMSPMRVNEPPTRRFDSFPEAARECSISRVYLGIHFRYDSELGLAQGREVGGLAVMAFLRPL